MVNLDSEMIRWGKLLFERRLISGWGGNLSCRVNENNFLITGQHAPLGFLTPEDIVELDAEAKPVKKAQRPSSETPMHMAIYAGTDAQAIVHVHPPLVLAFSINHDSFAPLSFEEKYTIGEVAIVAQDTPTATKPEKVVEALKYSPVAIIKGHGTVAIGKNFQEAFLFTDLLEEAVRCQFFKAGVTPNQPGPAKPVPQGVPANPSNEKYQLFSQAHMRALVDSANGDVDFRQFGGDTSLTTSLTLHMDDDDAAWTVEFVAGEIVNLAQRADGEFLISRKPECCREEFRPKIDAYLQ